jgi:hypothetical protein
MTVDIGASPVAGKLKRAIAAYGKAIGNLEDGSERDIDPAYRARRRIDKVLGEASNYAPGGYRDPIVVAMFHLVDSLPGIGEAEARGRLAREKQYREEIALSRDQQRTEERSRPR